jgi:hypothetical protein
MGGAVTWSRFAVLLGALLLAGCPGTDSAQPSKDAGATDAKADAPGSDAEAGTPWDPIWHDTAPKAWPTIGPQGQPDCGVGCRMLLNHAVPIATVHAFSFDATRIVSEGVQVGPMATKLDSTETTVFGPDPTFNEAQLDPYVAGRRVAFVRNLGVGDGQVEVMDLITGETKIVYRYTPAQAGTNNATRTALNSRYVFWEMDGKGLMSRDLQTGEVKLLMPGSFVCHDICATEHELICADLGSIYDIDLDTGKAGYLDYGGAIQFEGFCSPDRTQFVWMDYRDPPGRNSDYNFSRDGGEVYMRDLVAHKTRRITYDSPNSPHGKNFPAVDGDFVYWNQTPDGPNQNPDQAQTLYGQTTVLVRFDLSTGNKCELTGGRITGYKAAYGSKLVTLWRDPVKDEIRVVLYNLDDPGLSWQCQTEPIPP